MFLEWLNNVLQKSSRRKVYEQLQWQRFLLRTGIPATARILDMVEEKRPLPGYVQMRLWIELRFKGAIAYLFMETLIDKTQLPAIGDTIHIRYCPDDMSRIIIV
jgi:hypothetical protein